jgi:hypothetical protein
MMNAVVGIARRKYMKESAMPIGKDLLVVWVTVAAEVEIPWNKWYDEEHLPEVAQCPGFLSAQRYVTQDGGKRRYLTIYELENPDALKSTEFAARRGWGRFAPDVEFSTASYARLTVLSGGARDAG